MSDKSKIEWTDATWNPIRGCSRVSEGCRNCYAERVAARFSGPGQPYEGLAVMKREPGEESKGDPRWTGEVRFIPELLDQPLRWKKPRRIFVNSMSDLFHEKVQDEWIDQIFAVMAFCPQHTFQVLTKRTERMRDYFSMAVGRDGSVRTATRGNGFNIEREMRIREATAAFLFISGHCPSEPFNFPLPNVWLGVSVEDQKTADERIPLLLQTPAAVRWISYEPALDQVDFRKIRYDNICEIDSLTGDYGVYLPLAGKSDPKLNWVVVGGESGPGARPAHPDWFRAARDQCKAAGVPFFFKQWGEWIPVSQSVQTGDARLYRGMDAHGVRFLRLGKKRAGHLLDGEAWQQFPGAVASGK